MICKVKPQLLAVLAIFVGLTLLGGDFQVYHYANFDDLALEISNDITYSLYPSSKDKSRSAFFVAKTRSATGVHKRLSLHWITGQAAYNGSGRALSFTSSEEPHIAFHLDSIGDIPSHPDLFVSFQVFVPADGPSAFTFNTWNYENNINRYLPLKLVPGQWNHLKIPVNGLHFLPDGNIFRYFVFYNDGWPAARNFIVDEVAIWRGVNPESIVPVEQLSVREDSAGNHLSWQPPQQHPLPIVSYQIYRGTIPDFPLDSTTLLCQTTALQYFDQQLLRDGYYYRILAKDCSAE